MKSWMQRLYLKQIRHCIDTFGLIEKGDRILIGVSGGKDSSLLFYALTQLSKHKIYDFEVQGITVDHGMLGNLEGYKTFCDDNGLILNIHSEHYAEGLSHDNPYNPCYTCSRLRKGIVKRFAMEQGFNKIAFGHTKDDAAETFMMNVVKHGKLSAMPPILKDKETAVTLIRPLLYLEESAIIKAVDILKIPLMKDLCTFADQRTRSQAESLIAEIDRLSPNFSDQLIKAMHHVEIDRLMIKMDKE